MKLFRSDQIKQIDERTIEDEPIASIDLMERAAGQVLRWYTEHFERTRRIYIFAGPGNNGGDGLALARMLTSNRYKTEVHYVEFTDKTSADWKENLNRLKSETKIPLYYLKESGMFPVISSGDVIIDAIFGSGLTRPVEGLAADVIKHINSSTATIISIDIPSGMFGEDNTGNDYDSIVKADYTVSFHFPKLSFMFAENAACLGEWEVLPIGLSPLAISNINSPYFFLEKSEISPLLKKRHKFDHKGIFGHGLLIAGSFGKMGAAVLGGKAALRTGIGLITCHIPNSGVIILQSALPEAMIEPDKDEKHFSETANADLFDAVGIGPGIGTAQASQNALHHLLNVCKKQIVLDADALNILSLNKEWLSLLPEGAVLTPHPKEFERIAGKAENSYHRLMKQIGLSEKYKCIIVLKGAHTSVTTPEGKVYFNSTGNPGMATAGSGDVLTGIILSLLAQRYTPENAAVLGVFLHGLAGDFAAERLSYESIIASDIIKNLSDAFNKIREQG